MRTLHLIHGLYRGGLESWLLSMLEEIPRDVCAMDICCIGADTGPWTPRAEKLGARVLHAPLRVTHVAFMRELGRILRDSSYDLAHNHLGVYSGFPIWAAHRHGVPVLTTFHNTDFARASLPALRLPVIRLLRQAYGFVSINYAVRKTDMLTGVSQAVLDSVTRGRKKPVAKSGTLYLGVEIPPEPTAGEKAELRESLGLPRDTPLILHVGRFIEQKNHVGLIKIFEIVTQRIPQAKLLLVGEGPLQSDISDLVKSRDLRTSVIFLGFRNDVPILMTKCDVFILPSLHEGLPVAGLEAQAAGTPIVGSRVPGLTEAVDEARSAILHDPDDIQGMADSVVRILTDPTTAKQLGEEGKSRIKERFSRKTAADRLIKLYQDCLLRTCAFME